MSRGNWDDGGIRARTDTVRGCRAGTQKAAGIAGSAVRKSRTAVRTGTERALRKEGLPRTPWKNPLRAPGGDHYVAPPLPSGARSSVRAGNEVAFSGIRVGSSVVEQRPFKPLAVGSNPTQPTTFKSFKNPRLYWSKRGLPFPHGNPPQSVRKGSNSRKMTIIGNRFSPLEPASGLREPRAAIGLRPPVLRAADQSQKIEPAR